MQTYIHSATALGGSLAFTTIPLHNLCHVPFVSTLIFIVSMELKTSKCASFIHVLIDCSLGTSYMGDQTNFYKSPLDYVIL